ncbi:uncharacterized protein MKZ38_004537 [Zalerion maritima]|uniref:Enoyl reductase (ER) domain-containing protein n=1 Tax=Zalerion maritima TaxID=339359 RepID=A0AAD5RLT2_9PEZI|nr:uncharacterized protein MKZ38_004537 [Zalerion maritima]
MRRPLANMKAAVLTAQGPPSVLRLVDDYPTPTVDSEHVLVRVKAIAIGHSDLMTRNGIQAGPKFTPPKIIGAEFSGVIESVPPELERRDGDDVATSGKYRPGDVVVGLMGGMGRFFDGCYAELARLPPSCLSSPIPDVSPTARSDTFALIAAVPGSYLAAYGMLEHGLAIRAGDTLLIHGGSAATAVAALSLAKSRYGVNKVVGTTRNVEKAQRMREKGYDDVVVVDDDDDVDADADAKDGDFEQQQAHAIMEKAGEPEGFTAQIELIGADHVRVALACARSPGGSRVCMGGMLDGAYFFRKEFGPMGIPIGVSLSGYSSSFKDHMLPLPGLIGDALAGKLDAAPDKIFSFSDIVKAHEYRESSHTLGKVVCVLD